MWHFNSNPLFHKIHTSLCVGNHFSLLCVYSHWKFIHPFLYSLFMAANSHGQCPRPFFQPFHRWPQWSMIIHNWRMLDMSCMHTVDYKLNIHLILSSSYKLWEEFKNWKRKCVITIKLFSHEECFLRNGWWTLKYFKAYVWVIYFIEQHEQMVCLFNNNWGVIRVEVGKRKGITFYQFKSYSCTVAVAKIIINYDNK